MSFSGIPNLRKNWLINRKIKQKQLRAVKALNVKNSISVGAPVIVDSRSGAEKGIVTKIKRTKAVVEINGRLWNCGISILKAV